MPEGRACAQTRTARQTLSLHRQGRSQPGPGLRRGRRRESLAMPAARTCPSSGSAAAVIARQRCRGRKEGKGKGKCIERARGDSQATSTNSKQPGLPLSHRKKPKKQKQTNKQTKKKHSHSPTSMARDLTAASVSTALSTAPVRSPPTCWFTLAVVASTNPCGSSRNCCSCAAGDTKRSVNFARAHSMQWSIRCGKFRSVHMGIPPPIGRLG